MKIRIISGLYGGRIIDAPNGDRTHPMGERVRNAMFNNLGDKIKGAVVLDAFAGSGSIGIEAISRGASHATFIEKDRVANKIIDKNIKTIGIENQTKHIKSSVAAWVSTSDDSELFDIVFADPPYHDLQLSTVKRLMGYLKPEGLMILSHSGRGEEHFGTNEFVVVDDRSYGNAHLTFFRRVE